MTPAIRLTDAGKVYRLYRSSWDRLKEAITQRPHHTEAVALAPLSVEVARGEVVGVIGNNGAGKSTLLKLVAGMLTSDIGRVQVNGKIGALLELGSGFHPELTGRENVHLAGTVAGISPQEMKQLYPGIVEFSGIGDYIEQPVKFYSSGMFVRLAFAVATSIQPDILIIDEALSVGDGAFKRRSFDRIMALKERGVTILFCSHALFQVQALCSRVLWLDHGEVRALGDAQEVLAQYEAFLAGPVEEPSGAATQPAAAAEPPPKEAMARIKDVRTWVDDLPSTATSLRLTSGSSQLSVAVDFESDPALPVPHVAVVLTGEDSRIVTSVATFIDDQAIPMDPSGRGSASVEFPRLPLLKGQYGVDIYLMCEQGIHVYDSATRVAELVVEQQCLTQGVTSVPHRWQITPTTEPTHR